MASGLSGDTDRVLDVATGLAGGRAADEAWGRWFTQDPPARHGATLPLPESIPMRISIGVIAEAN